MDSIESFFWTIILSTIFIKIIYPLFGINALWGSIIILIFVLVSGALFIEFG